MNLTSPFVFTNFKIFTIKTILSYKFDSKLIFFSNMVLKSRQNVASKWGLLC